MIKRPSLQQRWKEFQVDRVQNIHEWYQEHYENSHIGDPLIKYIVLWSVFNALYNTFDLPNNSLPEKINNRFKFRNKFGHKTPIINTSGDFDRVMKIAGKLSGMENFIILLNGQDVKPHIETLVIRVPSVIQDEGIDIHQAIPIILQDENKKWTVESDFIPSSISGIASLDRRLFLTDGYRFFEYAAIDTPWNANGQFTDPATTSKQLLNVLYQLRNNIVHGGSTARSSKEIIFEVQPILDAIVGFIFDNSATIFTGI